MRAAGGQVVRALRAAARGARRGAGVPRAPVGCRLEHTSPNRAQAAAEWAAKPRSHACGELHDAHIGERVVLGGWMMMPR